MTENVYRKLQQYLDTMSVGFPPSKSGIELKILQNLFSQEDAELFLVLTANLETPEEIALRLGLDPAPLNSHLKDMRDRGLLFSYSKGDVTKYGTIAFVHGIFEFQVKKLGKELSQMFEEYYKEAFGNSLLESTSSFVRTIPVHESVDTKYNIAAFNDAANILHSQKLISVAECICRKEKIIMGAGCDKPREVCFMFGSMAKYYIDQGLGRQVDAEEAVRMLKEAQKAGLVTQPGTAQNPGGMCNCCGDCCGILRALNMTDKPAHYVTANYHAAVDTDACTGCEACLDRCQVRAIKMKNSIAEINLDRCIGCGLCVSSCPVEAIKMIPHEKQPQLPLNVPDQIRQLAIVRGITS